METKDKDKEVDSFEANDVQKKPGWNAKLQTTTEFIWNPSKKEFIGRTWSSWAKIGLFYLVFYSSLAAFFAIMLAGFFSTLYDDKPTQRDKHSLIKSNPGMGFRPMPNIESTLIRFQQGVPDAYDKYVKNLDSYLNDYYNQTAAAGDNIVNCTGLEAEVEVKGRADAAVRADADVCRVGKSMFADACTKETAYSYDEGKPCVLLKINKVYGWMPKPYSPEDLNDTSSHKMAQDAKKKMKGRYNKDYVGISCEGENDADADNMGNITYIPEHGFPRNFYPYLNQKNYQAPIVFLRFDNPKYGVLIQVWCRLWELNIKHHKNDKAGSIHFELLIN